MPGTFDVDVPASLLSEPAVQAPVYRYDGAGNFELLPNVQCEQVEFQVGPKPSTARFRYILDHAGLYDWPTQCEEIWPITARGPYVVQADDRVVVCSWTPEGNRIYLFDGFAQIPQANIGPQSQAVTFTAVGVESRAFDRQIGGRVQRDGSDLEAESGDRATDLPTRFNPSDGRGGVRPNCTPADHDSGQSDDATRHPVFADELLGDASLRLWTTAEAACYVLAEANDEEYVRNPDFREIRARVRVRRGSSPDGPVDAGDESSYTAADLPLRDLDVTNKTWPEVLDSFLSQLGMGFCFELDQEAGLPVTRVRVERLDVPSLTPRRLRLDRHRSAIDPRRSNLAALAMSRDVNQVVNSFLVETPPRRVELSVVLAPLFEPDPADASGNARNAFLKGRLADATAEVRRKYRWYGVDECGLGHWDGLSWAEGDPFDFSAVFPDDPAGERTYVRRLRPGDRKLLTKDARGTPRKAVLHYSHDYEGTLPAAWDGTGTWTEVASGWQLLDDRLGIEVTAEDPEQWSVGKGKHEIRGITWQADPPEGKAFALLLTVVVEDDIQLDSEVGRRVGSPTRYTRQRRVDARDHYLMEVVAARSWYNQTAERRISRDDTERAKDLARQYRAAHEVAQFAGSATLPYVSRQYALFDQVSHVSGRDLTFRSNLGTEYGEGPRYPSVVKVAWQFAGERQSTTIHLSDLRAEPPRA